MMKKPHNRIKDKIMIRFVRYLKYQTDTIDIRLLIALPSLLGLLIGLLWITIGQHLYGTLPRIPNFIITSVVLFMMGFSGIVIMLKKEFPGTITSIRGIPAIAIGVAVTIFLWGLAFLGIFRIIIGHM
jgi:hypothetical protein